jgi:hypothetical protein
MYMYIEYMTTFNIYLLRMLPEDHITPPAAGEDEKHKAHNSHDIHCLVYIVLVGVEEDPHGATIWSRA